MGPAETDLPVVSVRISLLVAVIVFGVSGNMGAILVHLKTFKANKLNGMAYLHLAVMDLVLCAVHASLGLVLECFGLVHPCYGYGPILKFLEKRVTLLLFQMALPLSVLGLTFIATVRCWRVFNAFGIVRNGRLMTFIIAADLAVVMTTVLLSFPSNDPRVITYKSATNSTSNVDQNHTMEWLRNEKLSNNCTRDEKLSNNCTRDEKLSINCTKETKIAIAPEFNRTELTTSVLHSEFGQDSNNVTYSEPLSNISGKAVTNADDFIHRLTFRSMIFMVGFGFVCILQITISYILISVKLVVEFRKVTSQDIQKKDFLRRQLRHFLTHGLLISVLMVTLVPAACFTLQNATNSFATRRLISSTCLLNSVINPYIYCLLTKINRSRLKNVLTSRKS